MHNELRRYSKSKYGRVSWKIIPYGRCECEARFFRMAVSEQREIAECTNHLLFLDVLM